MKARLWDILLGTWIFIKLGCTANEMGFGGLFMVENGD